MARELSQLLLDEGIVSPAGLLRALTRQREAGGTLDTALLELGLVAEARLVGALARAADLPAAPLSAYEQVDSRARRVFPSKVAERHGLAPFALDGRELSLVAIGPVDLGLIDEVSFMLSLHLAPHVGPEWRVRSLIQRLYGGSLSPRLARLAEQSAARGTSPGVLAALPEPWVLGGPITQLEPPAEPSPPAHRLDAPESTAPEAEASVPAPEPIRPTPGLAGFGREPGEPLEPLAYALTQALETIEADVSGPPPAVAAAVEVTDPGPPASAKAPETQDRSAPPGWTPEQARAALARAQTRDEVVVTVLRYARDFFEFATVFVVTRDAIAGHDGLGPEGDARDLARTVAIYASDPGIFRTTIETTAPYLGRVDLTAPGNKVVLEALGRGSPRTVLVTPILLHHRPVCLLYADNGRAPVSARRLGDLLLFCSTVGTVFERIIKARKGERPAGGELPPGSSIATVAPLPERAFFERPDPAWRGPAGVGALISPAEAEYRAAGGQLEPEEPFAALPPLAPATTAAVQAPPAPAEPAPAAPPPGKPASEAPPLALSTTAVLQGPPAPDAPAPEALPPEAPAPEMPPLALSTTAVLQGPPASVAPAPEALPPEEPAPETPALALSTTAVLQGPPAPEAPSPEALPPEVPAPEPLPPEEAVPEALPPEETVPEALPPEEPVPSASAPAASPAGVYIDPESLPEVSAEFALPDPEPAPVTASEPEPEQLPPEPEPEPEPEPQGLPDDPTWLVGAYLTAASGSPARASLLDRLVGHQAVAPVLCELLPGPIEVPPAALAATPAALQGPVFAALAAIGQRAVPHLLAVLTDPQPSRRRAAAALLGAIGDPSTLVPLADRCLDADPAVAEAAREALSAQRGSPAIRPIPERLRRALSSGLAARAGPAARALMALRDVESIPSLIQALDGTDPATAAAAAEALAAITLQRHGTDPRQWLLWWKQNRGRGRAEWLFGGLSAEDQAVRAAAAAELRRVASPPVRYAPSMTPEEREPAARAWATWFTRSGYRL